MRGRGRNNICRRRREYTRSWWALRASARVTLVPSLDHFCCERLIRDAKHVRRHVLGQIRQCWPVYYTYLGLVVWVVRKHGVEILLWNILPAQSDVEVLQSRLSLCLLLFVLADVLLQRVTEQDAADLRLPHLLQLIDEVSGSCSALSPP